jgi:hypothetical protein
MKKINLGGAFIGANMKEVKQFFFVILELNNKTFLDNLAAVS